MRRFFNLFFTRDVAGDRQSPPGIALQLEAQRFTALRIAVKQRHVGTLLRQRCGDGFANAACRTRYGEHLSRKPQPVVMVM